MSDVAVDPVCGMEITTEAAYSSVEYQEHTYYFCAPSCQETFEKDPEKYSTKREE